MTRFPRLPPGVRRFFRLPDSRERARQAVDDEVRFHLEMRIAALEAQGLTRERAEMEAIRRFGDVAAFREEAARAADRRVWMAAAMDRGRALIDDARFALRRLCATPMFTVAATLTIAIAIGATGSVFGVVDGVLLKPFPLSDPERVLYIQEKAPPPVGELPISAADFLDWRADNHAFSDLAAAVAAPVTVTGAGDPERVNTDAVTANYFTVLAMAPRLGRVLSAEATGSPEVVLTYGYWKRVFGGSPSVLGRTLDLDGRPFTIVGVVDGSWPGPQQMWTQLRLAGSETNRREHSLDVYGRLKAGTSVETARRDLQVIADRLARVNLDAGGGLSVVTVPLLDTVFGDTRPALLMLLIAAVCVLLIGSANLANLFLVRCLGREHEMAVRTALGATRRRLAGEMLVEAATLSVVAGAIGLAFAAVGISALRALAPAGLPRLAQVTVDRRLVAFCCLSTVATAVFFGVLPASRAARESFAELLSDGKRAAGSLQHRRLQQMLTVVQIVIAFVLLTGASLLVESFERFRRIDPGFRPEGVLTAQIALPEGHYRAAEQRVAFASQLLEGLRASPGIEGASASSGVPGTNGPMATFAIVGDPPPARYGRPNADFAFVSPEYFGTLGYRLLRGRGVLAADDGRSERVVVVDEAFANRFFASREPLGRQIVLPSNDTLRIVGVVASVKENGLRANGQPEIYLPFAQLAHEGSPRSPYTGQEMSVAVRTTGDPERVTPLLRHVLATIDPTVPISDVETMVARLGEPIATTKFSAFLASVFAALAVVLGALGVYSVLANIVGQRRREIAVRVALGAAPGRLVGEVLRDAAILAGVGIGIGSAVAWIAMRGVASLLVGVSPHDPLVFAGASAGFAVVALLAASIPALRTTRVNPVAALTST